MVAVYTALYDSSTGQNDKASYFFGMVFGAHKLHKVVSVPDMG